MSFGWLEKCRKCHTCQMNHVSYQSEDSRAILHMLQTINTAICSVVQKFNKQTLMCCICSKCGAHKKKQSTNVVISTLNGRDGWLIGLGEIWTILALYTTVFFSHGFKWIQYTEQLVILYGYDVKVSDQSNIAMF